MEMETQSYEKLTELKNQLEEIHKSHGETLQEMSAIISAGMEELLEKQLPETFAKFAEKREIVRAKIKESQEIVDSINAIVKKREEIKLKIETKVDEFLASEPQEAEIIENKNEDLQTVSN